MKYYFTLYIFLLIVCLLFSLASFSQIKTAELLEYKKMTDHILQQNYYKNFEHKLIFVSGNAPDTFISNFLNRKKLSAIYIHKDSTIDYLYHSVQTKNGTSKKLIFDFSRCKAINSWTKPRAKLRVVEKRIYLIDWKD